jgi:hypothetical protein
MDKENDSKQSRGGKARNDALSSELRSEIARKGAAARWNLPIATHGGELQIAGWVTWCYNLADGRRIMSQRGFMDIIGMRSRKSIGHRIGAILEDSALKDARINKLVLDTQNPIKFTTPNGVMGFGYEDRLIVDFCQSVLDQRRLKVLPDYAAGYADAAEKFVASLAKVGIAALIDSATGFEKVRDRKALEALLDRYLRHEFSAWAKRFPDEFYEQIFRLKGWEWKGMKVNRPSCVGNYTNDLVYARLEIGILQELQIRNPWVPEKRAREGYHHTLLTDNFGVPALAQLLHTELTIMRGFGPGKWGRFKEFMDVVLPRKDQSVQLLLGFYEDDFRKD